MSRKKENDRYDQPGQEEMPPEGAGIPAPEEGGISAPEEAAELFPGLEELQQALAEAQAQAAEYKDGWQRALADFQNYKRRTDAEKADTYQMAVASIVRRYLPILDDLERALAARPDGQPWADGIELIYRKLLTILENEGVRRIEANGQAFDPNFHEAVSQETADGMESGQVIAVVQNGYMLGDRVIRPAQVRVAE